MITSSPFTDTDYRILIRSTKPDTDKFKLINIYWQKRIVGVTSYAVPVIQIVVSDMKDK